MARDYNRNDYRGAAIIGDYSQAQSAYGFMSRVYGLMSVGLVLTAIVAYFVAGSESLIQTFIKNQLMFFLMIGIEFGLVLWLSFCINKMSAATAMAGFIAYSVVNGITFAVILMCYTQTSIAATFMITAGGFAGLSLFGYLTKRNLGWIGSFGIYVVFGLIIAMLVNIFLKSSAFDLFISVIGVVAFGALTAYDTQKLRQIGQDGLDSESMGKYAVLGALTLYLDFVNMFLFLLRIFGGRK